MRPFHHLSHRSYISLNTKPALTVNTATLPLLTATLVCNLEANVLGRCSATTFRAEPWQAGTHDHANIVAGWWSNSSSREKRGKWEALLSAGFTHLTTDADQKLLWLHYPNSHLWRMLRRTGGWGRRRKEEQHKIKIIKDRSRGMVVKAGTQLNDVY